MATFSLSSLLSKKLLIVSGKGGVGKTTVAVALGLLAAQAGKKTLIAEINSEEQIAHLLEHSDVGYNETELLPRLRGINITPKKAFEEYVLMQIKFKTLYKAVFENRFVKNFIEGTPGLPDLMSIGKIYSLVEDYDLVIVDAPATGHGIALLEIPSIVSNAVRIGPLKSESDRIDTLLHDKTKTSMVLVTLPEEMPVTETVEMKEKLSKKLDLSVDAVFLNQFHAACLTRDEENEVGRLQKDPSWKEALAVIELQQNRCELSALYQKRLKEELEDTPIVPLSFVYSSRFGLTEVETIASQIEEEAS